MAKEKTERKNLTKTLAELQKEHGAMSIDFVSNLSKFTSKVPVIPTGSLKLDAAIQAGGLPKGKIIEIYGPEASGKTLITLSAIAECQKRGGVAAFIDAEHAFSPSFAEGVGVDLERLIFTQPDFGEQGLSIVESLVETGEVDIIVVDSVANLTPKAEFDGEMDAVHVGRQARMMSMALRKLTSKVSTSETCLVFINQVRNKIGVLYGNPEETPGGKALKYYSSLRLEAKKTELLKHGEEPYGHSMRVKVVKNKVGMPFKQAEFDVHWNSGIDRISEIVDIGFDAGLIDQAGAWYTYEGERFQGKTKMKEAIIENKALYDKLEAEVKKVLKLDDIGDGSVE